MQPGFLCRMVTYDLLSWGTDRGLSQQWQPATSTEGQDGRGTKNQRDQEPEGPITTVATLLRKAHRILLDAWTPAQMRLIQSQISGARYVPCTYYGRMA